MTTRAFAPRGWSPPSPRSILIATTAAAVGLVAGLLINAASPNPTYGLQIIADAAVLAVVLVVAVIAPAATP